MSYILFLGFQAEKYKENPTIKVSINNFLVDEFDITGYSDCNEITIYSKNFKSYKMKTHELDNIIVKENITYKGTDFFNDKIFFKFFEINQDIINVDKENQIIIEVFNDNNNYVNGFMTKSSLLAMNVAYFVPKNIIENYNEFAKSYWSNFKLIKNNFIDCYDIKSFYRYKKEKFNLLPFDWWFAGETTEESYKNSIVPYTVTWTNDNTNLKETYVLGKTIGGNGILRISFDSSLLTYNEKEAENINTYLLYCLSNKYLEYENKRDIN